MKLYIKETTESSLFEQAKVGFIKMGYECIYYKDTPQDLTDEDIVIGYIRDIQKALLKLGKNVPEPIDYPQELEQFLAREIKKVKYEDLSEDNFPYFIKPVKHKLFTGKVIREFKDLIGVYAEELYYTEDVINITSEYRVYIVNKEIVGVKHYKGSPYISPKEKTVKEMITKYTQQPKVYSLDVGVTQDNKTILIEANSGFSLGNYGLDEMTYAKLLRDGYKQYVEEG